MKSFDRIELSTLIERHQFLFKDKKHHEFSLGLAKDIMDIFKDNIYIIENWLENTNLKYHPELDIFKDKFGYLTTSKGIDNILKHYFLETTGLTIDEMK
jgi:hypothetical protein